MKNGSFVLNINYNYKIISYIFVIYAKKALNYILYIINTSYRDKYKNR